MLILFVIWLSIVLLVNPKGNFAVNDDWAYAHNVQALVDQGKLSFSTWPAMTLIGQTIPAWIWSEIVGFSFPHLRVLTLLFGLFSIFIFYLLSGNVLGSKNAFLGSMLLMFNPFFLSTSFSFMTEIYYLTYLLLTLFFASRYYRDKKLFDLIFMLVFFAFAMLTRQIALIFAISFGVVAVLREKTSFKTFLVGAIPFVFGSLLLVGYKWIRLQTGDGMGTFSSASNLIKGISDYPFIHFFRRLGLVLLYVGFTLIPLVLIYFRSLIRIILAGRYVSIISGAVVIAAMIMSASHFPIGNVVERIGMGPRLIKDVVLGFVEIGGGLEFLWNVLYILSLISATIIAMTGLTVLSQSVRKIQALDRFDLLIGILIAGELSYLILNPIFFDRYAMILSFLIALLIIRNIELSFSRSYIAPILFGLPALISLSGFMSWQRARAELTALAQEEYHIDKKEMDAGFEFNAWHRVGPIGEPSYDPKDKSWWFVEEDNYLISSNLFPGYHVITSKEVEFQFMNPTKRVYLLMKDK